MTTIVTESWPVLAVAVALVCVAIAARARSRSARDILLAKSAAHEATGDGIAVVTSDGRVVDLNESAREALAVLGEQAEGSDEAPALTPRLAELLSSGKQGPLFLRTDTNRFFEVWASERAAAGALRGTRALVIRDATDRRLGERKLMRLAHYDSLTGLANRRLFIEQLADSLRRTERKKRSLALLYIDLDHFKEINDTLGHGAGDELLQIVAERFRQQLDPIGEVAADAESAAVFRLGGDEFAVVLSGMEDEEVATRAAREVLNAASGPLTVGGRSIGASATIGIAVAPRDGKDVETIVKHADAALYAAKSLGRARFEFYKPSFSSDSDRKHQIEQQLRCAIAKDELRLHYQPKVDLRNRTVASFEALLRWDNEVLGAVGPYEFIPIAEERGIISEIGAWCIEAACSQIRAWQDAGLEPVPVAVNVSSSQFGASNVHAVVSEALMRHNLNPSALEIELTESLLLQDNDDTALCLRDLRAIGVRVALDDFGTGYSALTYLNQFPLDIVKMDRGFLREMENSDTAAGIVSAVVSMCHSLGLSVVAEGVDSEEQLALLEEMGCDQAQGFLFAPALPPEQVIGFLAQAGHERPTIAPKRLTPGMLPMLEHRPSTGPNAPHDAARRDEPEGSTASGALRRLGPARVLALDGTDGDLGPIALRLIRLGFDVHHASFADEARLLVSEEGAQVEVVVAAPSSDLTAAAEIVESLAKADPDADPALIVLGDAPSPEAREEIRRAGTRWVMWHPFEDAELRFLVNAAVARPSQIEHRKVPRVPVNGMAWIRAGSRRESGVLANLSEYGAFIETSASIDVGSSVRVEFALPTGRIRAYAEVSYIVEEGDGIRSHASAGVGVRFFELERGAETAIRETIERQSLRYLP